MDAENLAGVYKEIARKTSVETAVEMYNLFRGQQVLFPQRLYSRDFIIEYVRENYDGHNLRELSQQFNYTDRHLRQIIRKSPEDSDESQQ